MPSSGSPKPAAFYPVGLNLNNQPVLVVGGGAVATRKIQRLLETGCQLTVISPQYSENLSALFDSTVTVLTRPYQQNDLENLSPILVFACTNDAAVNADIVVEANRLGIWVNSATEGIAQSRFIVPSVIQFEGLQIALSGGGASPILLRRLRETFEAQLGSWVGSYLQVLKAIRSEIKIRISDASQRRSILEQLVLDEALLTAIQANEIPAEQLRANWLAQHLP